MHPDSQIIAQLTAINQFCTVEAKTGEIMVDLATKKILPGVILKMHHCGQTCKTTG